MFVVFHTSQAQTGSSSIRGIVSDPNGQPVAGASVTLTNAEKNFSRTQNTNDSGSYVFSAVPPGSYELTVEFSGFKKASVYNINAMVETPTDQNV